MKRARGTSGYGAAKRIHDYSYAILNIAALAGQYESTGEPVIRLNIGDPTLYGFEPPPELTRACIAAFGRDAHSYTHSCGILPAREAIARDAAFRGIELTTDDIVITSGATEAADMLCTAMLNPGDEVLCPSPCYPLYAALISRQEAVCVSYTLDPGSNWLPDPLEIEQLITPRTRLLIIINPNNPTGAIYPADLLSALAEIAERHGILCLADEVYRKLIYSGAHNPFATFAGRNLPVFTLESLSKNYMAPGWRTGWMSITNSRLVPDIRLALQKLAEARVCAPAAPQFAIPDALSLQYDYLLPVINKLRERRDLTVKMINAIEGLSCGTPEGAFYVMAKVDLSLYPFASDEEFIVELLRKKRILCVHGSGFGTEPGDGYFRIVYLPDTSTLERVYNDFEDFLRHCR
ncbi:MAG: aminotransferase class I/II-fold pyridoxal phosphate-dependent enzyme [Chlorobium sp.]|jgi:alanine-synthesizing transaminase|uniref:pyridoxal phosphate-dependent aminotransferase n=1 Tax=Chlorobium sp. TaxID=1095 RepID=UPI001D6E0D77|nr:aminotransferase class I/II-fold pyridoxal phosphate-dependent enzyme [Chlorobium sp.]MBN1278939.1 aminotransferase class I/II-fold pyridoxal phosphate-dependent enzyme [Chlorobiaceae bacterium]MCF8215943.1 aminotransferase class I/II-fold pyridoxal phosphate-dependent enzyme [Chlorobium sp.]MCF8270841.1 aminotransferase class I/II-fold pyridoxal phosphate-dependent enzyme [Chlorobium sp.]MCF8287153.1 aminotransferase class I/II-fold pyridoxal phosphate-dependent enzyme [Chlorobium sp.]MCF8